MDDSEDVADLSDESESIALGMEQCNDKEPFQSCVSFEGVQIDDCCFQVDAGSRVAHSKEGWQEVIPLLGSDPHFLIINLLMLDFGHFENAGKNREGVARCTGNAATSVPNPSLLFPSSLCPQVVTTPGVFGGNDARWNSHHVYMCLRWIKPFTQLSCFARSHCCNDQSSS